MIGPNAAEVLPLANHIGQLAFTAHLPDLSPTVTEEGLFKSDASGAISEIFRITDGLAPLTDPIDDVALEAFNDTGQTVVSVDSGGGNTLVLLDPTGGASVIAA